jgi:hypothetical protein
VSVLDINDSNGKEATIQVRCDVWMSASLENSLLKCFDLFIATLLRIHLFSVIESEVAEDCVARTGDNRIRRFIILNKTNVGKKYGNFWAIAYSN